MITPTILVKGEALDLGEIPSVTIVEKNPFFNDSQGSYTLPVTVPDTQKNRVLLGYPERFQRMNKTPRTIDATIIALRNMSASLTVDSITESGYSLTLSVSEGTINNRLGTKKLSDFDFGEEPYASVELLKERLTRAFEGQQISDKYMIFPLIVGSQNNAPYLINYSTINIYTDPRDYEFYQCTCSEVHDSTVEYVDEITVVNPKGYAISPFLRLRFVLTKLFEEVGFTFDAQTLFTSQQMNNIVILNNVVDAIVRGKIVFKQLLPELTAIAFVTAIEKQFCGKFITSGDTCRFVFFNRFKSSLPKLTLDNYIITTHTPKFSPFQKLILKPKRSIKSSDNKDYGFFVDGNFGDYHGLGKFSKFLGSDVNLPTYDEFYSKYRENITVFPNHTQVDTNSGINYYAKNLGMLMRRTVNGNTATIEPISTLNFDYTATVDSSVTDEKNIQLDNEALPLMPAIMVSKGGAELKPFAMPVFGVGKATPNTKVIDAKKAEKDAKCPLCLCFGYTNFKESGVDPRDQGYYTYDLYTLGSPLNKHPETGEVVGDLSLCIPTESGIYNQFYKEYATFLKSSNQPVTVKANQNLPISFTERYLLFGQEVYIEEAKYNTNNETIDLTLLTAKTYEPIINEDNTSIDL